MSIFKGLFHSRDKPQNLGSATFNFGGTISGKAVTEQNAMTVTAVYACVRILAEAIGGLPLHVYRYKPDGGKERVTAHPLFRLLHDAPNPEMTSFVFR
jgi:phage portal protein BeeE